MREDFDPFRFPAPHAASLIDTGRPGSRRPEDPDNYLARVDARTAHADRRTSKPDDFHDTFALNHPHVTSEVGTTNFFRSAGWVQWVVLVGFCVVLLWVDFSVFSKFPQGFKWHVSVVVLWIVIAVGYDMWIEGSLGNRRAFEWIYGYMLEWMLSMDNLFVFHLLFTTFRTPASQQRKAVFVGIFCAVVFRLVFFLVVATLLHAFGWVRWPVGAMLIYSGIGAVWEDDDDEEMELKDMRTVRALRLCFGARVKDDYAEEPHLVTFDEQGRWQLSMLFVVVSIIELSDVIFALDSVSAKTAQIPDQYIAFSSSVLAMYGLRAMFFVIQSLVEMFELLKYGLAVILVYIGVELMFANFFHLSKGLTCICILGIFALCIGASLVKQRAERLRALAGGKGAGSGEWAAAAAEPGLK